MSLRHTDNIVVIQATPYSCCHVMQQVLSEIASEIAFIHYRIHLTMSMSINLSVYIAHNLHCASSALNALNSDEIKTSLRFVESRDDDTRIC